MRIVSLLPAATEIVALLGATEHLVGITHACDYPEVVGSRARVTRPALRLRTASPGQPDATDDAVRELAHAGTALFTLDEARIRALHPDLFLTQSLCDVCAVREDDVRALAARLAPVPRIVTLGGTSLEGVYTDIQAVADAVGAQSDAEELLAGLRDRVKHVHDTLKAAKAPRPRAAIVEWTSPMYLAGHWGPEQITRAGGIPVIVSSGTHSVQVPVDQLSASEPEYVFIAPCGYSLADAAAEGEQLLHSDMWSWLRGRQVWALDANGLVSRPGPRLVDGIEAMARVMNPMIFSKVDARHARRIA